MSLFAFILAMLTSPSSELEARAKLFHFMDLLAPIVGPLNLDTLRETGTVRPYQVEYESVEPRANILATYSSSLRLDYLSKAEASLANKDLVLNRTRMTEPELLNQPDVRALIRSLTSTCKELYPGETLKVKYCPDFLGLTMMQTDDGSEPKLVSSLLYLVFYQQRGGLEVSGAYGGVRVKINVSDLSLDYIFADFREIKVDDNPVKISSERAIELATIYYNNLSELYPQDGQAESIRLAYHPVNENSHIYDLSKSDKPLARNKDVSKRKTLRKCYEVSFGSDVIAVDTETGEFINFMTQETWKSLPSPRSILQ